MLDIIELGDYLAQDDPALAERFVGAIEAAFEFLLRTPGAGAPREYPNSALQGLRVWPTRGFEKVLIFYRELHGELQIIRVLHAARDIAAIFEADE